MATASMPRLFRSSSAAAAGASFLRRFLFTAANTDGKTRSCATNRIDPKNRNVQWVFLGCPSVGKCVYASRLSALLGVPHIATGDLFREELSSSGPLSKQLEEIEILNEVTDIDLVVNLKLPENVLLEKCLGRRICSECGKNFNVASINVKGENGNLDIRMDPLNPPSHCLTKLITRSDDTEAIVKERLIVYNEKSRPVEEYYRAQGKMFEFDLPGGIPESWPKLLEALNLDENEDKRSAAA